MYILIIRTLPMVLRPNKCGFGSESVEYCGFLINQHEYRVKPDRVEAINNFYKPKDC